MLDLTVNVMLVLDNVPGANLPEQTAEGLVEEAWADLREAVESGEDKTIVDRRFTDVLMLLDAAERAGW